MCLQSQFYVYWTTEMANLLYLSTGFTYPSQSPNTNLSYTYVGMGGMHLVCAADPFALFGGAAHECRNASKYEC